jgi:diaminopimelate epimerase
MAAFDPADPALFYKMTGSGNDFVVLDGRYHQLDDWPVERIRALCDRRRGIGADGLVVLETGPGAVRMHYFNADGSRAEMCGNAALCSTRLAASLGLADPARVNLDTDSGLLRSRVVGPGWLAELGFPEAPIPRPLPIPLESGERAAYHGIVGVPHLVVEVDDIDAVDLIRRGRALRYDARFGPAGTNVNFVAGTPDPDAGWAMRTYERGVEAETLACGTGTVATALALAGNGRAALPLRIRSRSGAVFSIAGTVGPDRATDVWLAGEGRLVFTGRLAD